MNRTPHVTDAPYLDITDPSFSMHSEAVRDARERSWYARTNYGLAVLRYAEVTELLRHPSLVQGSARWPDHHGVHDGPFHAWWARNLLVLEGDEHHRIRRLLNPAFSTRSARRLEPVFTEVAEELVSSFAGRGHAEFVSEFAEPYATRALCAMMALPHSDWPFIAEHANTIGLALTVSVRDDIDRIDAAVRALHDYVETLIAARVADPGEDIVSQLVHTSAEDGDRLSAAELRNAVVLMLFGGMDTTRNQLGLMLRTFLRLPDQWELVASRPELARAATEEALRVAPTTTWVTREAAETFSFGGVEITEGTTVHLFTRAAGTDPRAYPGGGDVDVTAEERRPHRTFGGGIHHCIGHQIARTDLAVALRVLTGRLTDVHPAGGDEWLPDSGNTGPIRYPITFTARA
ncbi:cytochrome P450 [Pseudonocardia nematodicida]|uniref:Cytochrome P450 n=1 Tax=Pseudonocardia nematodicida TaxID=1206997 RepID=A0ABV1K591_9PSEU